MDEAEEDGPYAQEDFLKSIVKPLWKFLEHEVKLEICVVVASKPLCQALASDRIVNADVLSSAELQVLKRRDEMVCERVMYDDVNETFWADKTVHALLPTGCAHVPGPYVSAQHGASRRAYVHLRRLLRNAVNGDDISGLKRYFRKTYVECVAAFEHRKSASRTLSCRPMCCNHRYPGWIALYQAFHRVHILHAILLHLTFGIAFFGFEWEALSTWVITHSLLKALRTFMSVHLHLCSKCT